LAAGADVVTGTPGRVDDFFKQGKLAVDQVGGFAGIGFTFLISLI
jgi:superfamily II DNA/RNA helicase